MNVHESAADYLSRVVIPSLGAMKGRQQRLPSGTNVIDLGCHAKGGLRAGLAMAELCLAGLADVGCQSGGPTGQQITVRTDHPVRACMASQYGGWPISIGKFFSMGSGPMRASRGKEKMLEDLELIESAQETVGVLESKVLPDDDVACQIAAEANVAPASLTLVVARTASLAGTLQIVARSAETCLHKLHELGFDLSRIDSAFGTAPLPPVAAKDLQAMGWTNDAILYGGSVTLWLRGDDQELSSIVEQVPSSASSDFGRPFLAIFEQNERDFYKIDPQLFSPAEVTIVNRATGTVLHAGQCHHSILKESFRWP